MKNSPIDEIQFSCPDTGASIEELISFHNEIFNAPDYPVKDFTNEESWRKKTLGGDIEAARFSTVRAKSNIVSAVQFNNFHSAIWKNKTISTSELNEVGTSKSFRGKRILPKLIQMALIEEKNRKINVTFAVPNRAALPAYKKGGFLELTQSVSCTARLSHRSAWERKVGKNRFASLLNSLTPRQLRLRNLADVELDSFSVETADSSLWTALESLGTSIAAEHGWCVPLIRKGWLKWRLSLDASAMPYVARRDSKVIGCIVLSRLEDNILTVVNVLSQMKDLYGIFGSVIKMALLEKRDFLTVRTFRSTPITTYLENLGFSEHPIEKYLVCFNHEGGAPPPREALFFFGQHCIG